MSGVLKALVTNSGASAAEVASSFGFGAPFTNKYKTWLQKTGLLKGKGLTPYGEVIFESDPKFESAITQWFMHHQLIKNPTDAEAWYFFIMEFLPLHDSFSRTQLETALEMKLMSHSVEHFSKGRPMNRVISKKLIDCYLQKEALGGLGLLRKSEEDGQYIHSKPDEPMGPWETSDALASEY